MHFIYFRIEIIALLHPLAVPRHRNSGHPRVVYVWRGPIIIIIIRYLFMYLLYQTLHVYALQDASVAYNEYIYCFLGGVVTDSDFKRIASS